MTPNLKILLADENHYRVLLIEREVARCSGTSSVRRAKTGKVALDLVKKEEFDLAIVDADLTGFRELEILDGIRRGRRAMPVIVLVSENSERQNSGTRFSNSVRFLVKDNSFPESLGSVIDTLVKRPPSSIADSPDASGTQAASRADSLTLAAATLSHEINNPLMTILGISELILNNGRGMDSDVTRKVRIIQRSARRIEFALKRLASIRKPSIRETVSGALVDLRKSKIWRKSRV